MNLLWKEEKLKCGGFIENNCIETDNALLLLRKMLHTMHRAGQRCFERLALIGSPQLL